jgi:hypothetical protein
MIWQTAHMVACPLFFLAALDRYPAFYNHRHSHPSYRTRDRRPGEIFLSHEGKRHKRRRFQSVHTHPV